jgi:hypothetical protein
MYSSNQDVFVLTATDLPKFVRVLDRRTVMMIGVSACGLAQLSPAIAWTVAPASETSGRVVVAFIALFV